MRIMAFKRSIPLSGAVVGDVEVHNGMVDANQNISFSKPATASGEQMVYIFINGTLVSSYILQF